MPYANIEDSRAYNRAYDREHRKNNDPVFRQRKRRNRRSSHLRRNYGLSIEDVARITREQDNNCPICGLPLIPDKTGGDQACVDHDHKTKVVRGIVHDRCNRLLACCNDNVATLYGAVKYLTKPRAPVS